MRELERVELTTLTMVTDGRGNVLVQDRRDRSWPGITFPGGHVEPGESFVKAAIREVYEETGLTIRDPVPLRREAVHGERAALCGAVFQNDPVFRRAESF